MIIYLNVVLLGGTALWSVAELPPGRTQQRSKGEMEKLKRTKQVVNAIVSFEMANQDNDDFMKDNDEYVMTCGPYFWGYYRKIQDVFTKSEVEKIPT